MGGGESGRKNEKKRRGIDACNVTQHRRRDLPPPCFADCPQPRLLSKGPHGTSGFPTDRFYINIYKFSVFQASLSNVSTNETPSWIYAFAMNEDSGRLEYKIGSTSRMPKRRRTHKSRGFRLVHSAKVLGRKRAYAVGMSCATFRIMQR
jgi:hypothetical protein